MKNVDVAANSLGQLLFKARYSDLGSVGVTMTHILVYIKSAQTDWKGPTPTTWEGFRVEWRFNMGAVIATGTGAKS
jgi:hypothetical protein